MPAHSPGEQTRPDGQHVWETLALQSPWANRAPYDEQSDADCKFRLRQELRICESREHSTQQKLGDKHSITRVIAISISLHSRKTRTDVQKTAEKYARRGAVIWALFARVGHSGVVQIALSQSTAPSSFPRDVFGSSRSIPASFGADKSAHGKSLRKKLGERPLFAQWQPQPPLAAAAMLVSTMFTSHCSCLLNSLCAFSTSSATHRLLRAVANNRTCFTPHLTSQCCSRFAH